MRARQHHLAVTHPRLEAIAPFAPPPCLALDVPAMLANAETVTQVAGNLPIRVVTHAIRSRHILDRLRQHPKITGLMAFSLPEALWLVARGHTNVLVAYPSMDHHAIHQLATNSLAAAEITVCVDHPTHAAQLAAHAGPHQIRVCLDVDTSWQLAGAQIGARRSLIQTVDQAVTAAKHLHAMPELNLVGLMFYDAFIAGTPDSGNLTTSLKWMSRRQLHERRHRIIDQLNAIAPLEFINGGGTGSLRQLTAADGLTELAAGSGFLAPVSQDRYRDISVRPALFYALPVIRAPHGDLRTVWAGAHGDGGPDRQAAPVFPTGLRVPRSSQAAGVHVSLAGSGTRNLRVGDHVWWRPYRAEDVLERFATMYAVEEAPGADLTVTPWKTYRGENQHFG